METRDYIQKVVIPTAVCDICSRKLNISVTPETLFADSGRCTDNISRTRAVLVFMLRNRLGMSYTEIARYVPVSTRSILRIAARARDMFSLDSSFVSLIKTIDTFLEQKYSL
ncbi:MAG: hypothetical protein HUK08_00180 [Bacteroidaceae bacterium]|nr:hypothetical protein [Bacteroidaceae bacterium]